MRFRQVRPHEERPVRPTPSIGHVVIALTILPPEQLPTDVEFADIVEQVAEVVRKPIDEWYRSGGHELLLTAPDVA